MRHTIYNLFCKLNHYCFFHFGFWIKTPFWYRTDEEIWDDSPCRKEDAEIYDEIQEEQLDLLDPEYIRECYKADLAWYRDQEIM